MTGFRLRLARWLAGDAWPGVTSTNDTITDSTPLETFQRYLSDHPATSPQAAAFNQFAERLLADQTRQEETT